MTPAAPQRARPVSLVAGLQACLLIPLAALVGTWNDEEYTLATTAHGIAYAFGRAVTYELQAPLYFCLMAAWRELNGSVFFARAFSVGCAIGLSFAAAAVARRVAPGRRAAWFAAAVAFNPFCVFAALEIRLYALGLLLSALAWVAFADGFLADVERPRARLAFALLMTAAGYVQYYLALPLVAYGVALWIAGRRRALAAYAAWAAAIGLALVPAAAIAYSQLGSVVASVREPLAVARELAAHPLLDFLLPADGLWSIGANGALAQRLLATCIVAGLVAARTRLDRRGWAFVSIGVVVEAQFLILALLHVHLIAPRHLVALVVPALAGAYAVLVAVPARARPFALGVAAVYALGCGSTLLERYHTGAKIGDWPRVATYLATHAQRGETIAIFPPDALPAFDRYYRGPLRALPFPGPVSPDRYDEALLSVQSVAQASDALTRLVAHGPVWLAVSGCGDPAEAGCGKLEAALAQFRVVEDVPFYQNRLRKIVSAERAADAGSAREDPRARRPGPPTRSRATNAR